MGATSYGPADGQFLAKASLLVSSSKGSEALVIEDSGLRFRFEVRANDVQTPNTLVVRIYNLSESTRKTIIAEFDSVTLQAGFQYGNFGIIFQGNIKQFRYGRERNVDSYLDILAADGDEAYNFGLVNKSFTAGATGPEQLSEYAKAMGIPITQTADGYLLTGGIQPNPRGKVAFGLARDYMRDLSHSSGTRWSIQNGVLTLVPVTGYLPGDIVLLNTSSGMIGTPESTADGIKISCLLNPLIKIGQRVQINNADINQAVIKDQHFPSYTSQYFPATTSNDGIYRVLVVEHVGDTRGNDWQTELTCLDIDITAKPGEPSVLAAG